MRIKNITVLLPTFNCAQYINSAVKSILNQTFKDFELLIIDDGSTDNTEERIYEIKDSRIKYIQRLHKNCAAATNFGLKEASFDWVAKMDSDDISNPSRLQIQLDRNICEENEVISSWGIYFNNTGICFAIESPIQDRLLKRKMSLHSYILNSSVIYNRKFILQNGGYNENISRFEDYELWLRLLNKIKFTIIPQYLVFVRVREKSSSNYDKFNTRKMIYEIQRPYFNSLEEYFGIPDRFDQYEIAGWREFFFGEKEKARKEWKKLKIKNINNRTLIAYLLTYLSDRKLHSLREKHIRLTMTHELRKCLNAKYRSTIKNSRDYCLKL